MSDALTENITLFMNRRDCIPLFLPHTDKHPLSESETVRDRDFSVLKGLNGQMLSGQMDFKCVYMLLCVCVYAELQSRLLTDGIEWCFFTLFYGRSRGHSASHTVSERYTTMFLKRFVFLMFLKKHYSKFSTNF